MRLGREFLEFTEDVTEIDFIEKVKEVHDLDASYKVLMKSINIEVIEPSQSADTETMYDYYFNVILDGQECKVYDLHNLSFNNVEIESCVFAQENGSIQSFVVDYTF